jgi:hypothetical protein
VGPHRTKFILDQEITEKAHVLKAANDNLTGTGNSPQLDLTQVQIVTFERFMQWARIDGTDIPCHSSAAEFWSTIAELYIFAEWIDCFGLQRYLFEKVLRAVQGSCDGPSKDLLIYVYNNTGETSVIRKLMVAFYVWQASEGWWVVKNTEDWAFEDTPAEFQFEVSVATLRRVNLMDDGNPFDVFIVDEALGSFYSQEEVDQMLGEGLAQSVAQAGDAGMLAFGDEAAWDGLILGKCEDKYQSDSGDTDSTEEAVTDAQDDVNGA